VPDRHHPNRLTKKNPPKNKSQNRDIFLDAKKQPPTHHDLPRNHHNFTTKTPHQNIFFRQNPSKKRRPTTKQKILESKKMSGPAIAEPPCF
jgi:hypothetical protein